MSEKKQETKKAIILFSGGLDSSTCLYWALKKGYKCIALNVFYGQRHKKEIQSARAICKKLGVELLDIKLPLVWLEGATSLVGNKELPSQNLSKIKDGHIPSTYVPARNLIFAALGVSLAEARGAQAVILGANAIDYSGYPDCRPQFYAPLNKAVLAGTKCGVEGKKIKILTPLLHMTKAQIVRLGLKLGVPFSMTWSCYKGGKKPCGVCDSCRLRAQGFWQARAEDK